MMANDTEGELLLKFFDRELYKFIDNITQDRNFDYSSRDKFLFQMEQVLTFFKPAEQLPKSLLWKIRKLLKVLDAEAPFLPSFETELSNMIDIVEENFDLLLLGECRADRVTGVPRAI